MFWKKKTKPSVQSIASINNHTVPQKDELWRLNENCGDPFPSKNYNPVVILNVKSGWVRYYINERFSDQRMTIETFCRTYAYCGKV